MRSEPVLAIDFGTSNSLIGAWMDGRRVEALPVDAAAPDPTLMRTLLYFPNGDVCFYGSEALRRYLENEMEGRLFRSFKSHLPNRNYLGTFIDDRPLTLEYMVGVFLLEMKRRAEAQLKRSADTAVIGRPARYSLDAASDNFALHRMMKAAEFAGFKRVEFVPEPLAAALDLRRELKIEKIALIGDFGGGTSDFTLIRLGPYPFCKEHVLGLDGCPLAGDALDSLFMSERLNAHFGARAEYKIGLGRNRLRMPPAIMDRLNRPAHIAHLKEPATYEFIREVRKGALSADHKSAIDRLMTLIEDQQIFSFFERIESTKRALSDAGEAKFVFDYPGLEVRENFTRAEFTDWAGDALGRIFSALDECLKQAGVSSAQVDLVCMTGGSAKVPLIREALEKRFGAAKMQTQSVFHSVLSGLVESAGLL
jgi:hypothetical chaperone protein